jgi:hypothetical protein
MYFLGIFETFQKFKVSEFFLCSFFCFAKCVEVVFPTYCFDYQLWRCCRVVYRCLLIFL